MTTEARTAATTFDRVALDLAHAAFPELAAAVRARLDRILKHSRRLSLQSMPHLDRLTLTEFEQTLAVILAAVADAIESADPAGLRGVVERAPAHGIHHFVQQHALLDLFEEVRIVRGVIIVELAKEMQRPLTMPEAATFHAIFDIVIQQGVMALVREQEELLHQAQVTMRAVNERLLVSVLRQNELTEQAEQSQAALRRSEAELEDELAAAQELHRLMVRMLEAGDGEALYAQFVESAAAIMHADFASMQMVDAQRGDLRLLAYLGFSDDAAREWKWVGASHATTCGVAFRTAARAIVPDVERCEWLAGTADLAAYRQTGIRAVQSTPLISRDGGGGRVIGMLSTHWREPVEPTAGQLRAMDVLARQTADLLDRRAVQAALRQSEADFRMVADNISQLAWTCDVLGDCTWYNQRWLDYTGLTFEEMQGWGWRRVQHPDHLERVVARVKQSAESGELWEDTFPLRGRDGEYRWFLSRAVPIRDEAGRIVRWFGTNTDISERIELEDRVAEQSAALANESRRKDEFLAMLSHELRNPLAPIRSALHLLRLQERPGSENAIQQEAREVIERQVGNLTKLVSDLLEVSRVVSGRVRLATQTVDLNQVVRHAIETVTPLVTQRGHVLDFTPSPQPLWCDVDPTRIEEVFINLLNNAAKYTPDGGRIEVLCELPGDGQAQVRVRDTGIGIPPELLPRVFDLFTQADRSLARSAGGLGIGLSLAHRLVDLHGGTIAAHSPPADRAAGSEFIVRLALSAAAPPPTPAPAAPAAAKPDGVRVLVVDDNIDSATMLATLLRHAGYSVQSAYTGPDGLQVAEQWRPDILLLDIGLPGLDGYGVARRIRSAREPDLRKARLIALTGYGRDSDVALAREAGFDAHLVKPIDLDQLEKLMAAPSA